MFSQYFGSYLLNKDYLTTTQLQRALELQDAVHLKLGILALNEGLMTPEQINTTHHKQQLMDKKFGEIAVELGYLTDSQVNQLLSTQKKSHLQLGQALIEEEYLTLEQLNKALEDYKSDFGLSNKSFAALQEDNIEEIVQVYTDFTVSRYYKIYSDYASLFLKNMMRLMNLNSHLEHNKLTSEYKASYMVYQEINGPVSFFTAIASNNVKTMTDLAANYAGEKYKSYDELSQAALAEFLNLHNGIFLVNMSDRDVELELNPQVSVKDTMLQINGSGYVIPINTSFGKFDLILAENVTVS